MGRLIQEDCIGRLAAYKKEKGHSLGITRLGIFGSVARNQHTENSDLDVVVEMDRPTLRNMYELESNLCQLFGCKIDLVQMRPTLRPLLKQYIQRDAIYV